LIFSPLVNQTWAIGRIPDRVYTERIVGDKSEVLNTVKAVVTYRLIRRCIDTNLTIGLINLYAQTLLSLYSKPLFYPQYFS